MQSNIPESTSYIIDIFKKGIGCGYSELLRLAENGIIASEKPTKKVIDKKRKSNLKINSKKK